MIAVGYLEIGSRSVHVFGYYCNILAEFMKSKLTGREMQWIIIDNTLLSGEDKNDYQLRHWAHEQTSTTNTVLTKDNICILCPSQVNIKQLCIWEDHWGIRPLCLHIIFLGNNNGHRLTVCYFVLLWQKENNRHQVLRDFQLFCLMSKCHSTNSQ